MTKSQHANECPECKGTGKIDFIPLYFIESGGVLVSKYELADGTFRDLTLDEMQEDLKCP